MKISLFVTAVLTATLALAADLKQSENAQLAAQVDSEIIPIITGLMEGGGGTPCKSGPGHQNTPTINLVDTSQKQFHQFVPIRTPHNGHEKIYESNSV